MSRELENTIAGWVEGNKQRISKDMRESVNAAEAKKLWLSGL